MQRPSTLGPEEKEAQIIGWAAYAVTLALSFAGVVILLAAPWFRALGHEEASAVVYEAFRPVCHQDPARSFHLFEQPLAICSRCTALVIGGMIGLLIIPVLRSIDAPHPSRKWLAMAAALCAADFALPWFGIGNTFFSRSLTGGLLGATMAFYLVPAMVSAAREIFSKGSLRQPTTLVPAQKSMREV